MHAYLQAFVPDSRTVQMVLAAAVWNKHYTWVVGQEMGTEEIATCRSEAGTAVAQASLRSEIAVVAEGRKVGQGM